MKRLLERAGKVITPALHHYYPLEIVRGDGIYVEAADGRKYLDFSSGIAVLNIGHCHPAVKEAIQGQIDRFMHTGGVYYNETIVNAAERLLSVTPDGLDMLFFGNSGTESVEAALKLARFVTGRQGIVSFTGAFHGRTLGAVSITTSSAKYRNRYHPLLPSVYQVPYPYCFRCPFNCKPDLCDLTCLEFLKGTLRRQIYPDEVAAFIIEPILGEGGYHPAPLRFLQGLRKICDEHGILLIFDEVQSGIGRTGWWFAAGHYGVSPDILTVAKGIASGLPLSAVIASRHVMKKWAPGAHGTTFGGNPVACAAAMATLDVIEQEGLLSQVREISEEIVTSLEELAVDYPLIGDIRGLGYMIGIEFVTETGAPNRKACDRVLQFCLEKGLILIPCGLERNIVRFIPPLITKRDDIRRGIEIFAEGVGKAV
ncbi:MAG: aspartate aminotransferase family protein [Geobacter sp.]|nr:aspartate aminotransferase family protein [Geobacter sp.]